jgi:hypothetical protein
MKREIKFRDYDLNDKIMAHYDLEEYDNSRHNTFGTIMQFTGLKDNNGKEIYEGDILRYNSGTKTNLFEVQFMQARFKALLIGRSDDTEILGSGLWDGSEVIGNIYENPELISEPS